MHHRLKRLPAVLAALALAGCSGDLLSPSGARRNVIPPAHDPVIFVHGWRGTASTWTTMIGRFKADGWTDAELSNFTYNSDLSNATTAKLLAARIDSVLAATGSTFLKSLNATDETPGTPRYATWWSPCDEVINPDSSVPLTGAANNQTACLSHSALHQDATVCGKVRDWVK